MTEDYARRSHPKVGIIGTGFAARQRAQTILQDPGAELVAAVGHSPAGREAFCREFQVPVWEDPATLWENAAIDLVFISTINQDHASLVRTALKRNLHVVVEYPLALDLAEARELINLARERRCLLHVEHIELLSGIHQSLRSGLAQVGCVHLVRYSTINAKPPEPGRWTFSPELFGFPLFGAVSRINRLIDLLGPVEQVFCENRYFGLSESDGVHFYRGCLCLANLRFTGGAVGEVVYAKGEGFWRSQMQLELVGSTGALIHDGERLVYLGGEGMRELDPGSKRGLFNRDTLAVLAALRDGEPLYIKPHDTLHALAVAAAAERSAQSAQVERVETF